MSFELFWAWRACPLSSVCGGSSVFFYAVPPLCVYLLWINTLILNRSTALVIKSGLCEVLYLPADKSYRQVTGACEAWHKASYLYRSQGGSLMIRHSHTCHLAVRLICWQIQDFTRAGLNHQSSTLVENKCILFTACVRTEGELHRRTWSILHKTAPGARSPSSK